MQTQQSHKFRHENKKDTKSVQTRKDCKKNDLLEIKPENSPENMQFHECLVKLKDLQERGENRSQESSSEMVYSGFAVSLVKEEKFLV